MARARETADIIHRCLPPALAVERSAPNPNLNEGRPAHVVPEGRRKGGIDKLRTPCIRRKAPPQNRCGQLSAAPPSPSRCSRKAAFPALATAAGAHPAATLLILRRRRPRSATPLARARLPSLAGPAMSPKSVHDDGPRIEVT